MLRQGIHIMTRRLRLENLSPLVEEHELYGSERPFGTAAAIATSDGQAAKARWEDDGGPFNVSAAVVPEKRPEWSVQSLRLLNQAIHADPAEQARGQSIEQHRQRLRVQALNEVIASAAALLHRDRRRSAGEHL